MNVFEKILCYIIIKNCFQMDTISIFRGMLIIFFIGVLAYLISEYTKKQKEKDEGFEEIDDVIENELMAPSITTPEAPVNPTTSEDARPNEPLSNEDFKKVNFKTNELPKDCFPKDKLTSEDLLPKDAANSKWAQVNPAGQGDLKDKNFLNAGFHIGINTVGNSLRNPNLQLRSEPPNPQLKVSPWNQTTIESDLNRRPLEIGGCE
uniref:Minor capsid protein P11 C-terminal conserved region domain-containing protein n=1 Tax=viral metagenome TaxID=1070528 RepID=A0A6C0CTV8_9ZZZZ